MDGLTIRNINISDYDRNYLFLLKQLTDINPEIIDRNTFNDFINGLNDMHSIIVIEDISANIIIGSGTLLVEQKLIHNMGKVGHIEDIVVDEKYRGRNLGKKIIEYLIDMSNKSGCYKAILDCSDKNVEFYKKCGFEQKGVEMALYFRSKI